MKNKTNILSLINRNIKYFGFVVVFFGVTLSLAAKDCEKVKDKKAIRLYEAGMRYWANGTKKDKREAYFLFKEAIEIVPEYALAHFQIAEYSREKAFAERKDMNNRDRNLSKAEKYYKNTIEYCSLIDDYTSFFHLAYYYYNYKKNFSLAEKNATLYLSKNKKNKYNNRATKIVKQVKEYNRLKNNPVPFNPKRVQGVCSIDDDFLPLISPDGELAFYTHRYAKRDLQSTSVKWVDEFSYSERKDAMSREPIFNNKGAMPSPFNQSKDEDQGGVAITIDNKLLYLTICEFTEINGRSYKNCDIFVSHNIDGEWTTPTNLGPNINGNNTWEGQPSISSDGNKIYFASARPGGYGGIDIYCASKDKNGFWQEAQNIGEEINTEKDDKSPFMHSDSQTLYFASNGGYGLGGFDIYFSRKNANTWETPINIGYPINTEKNELGFIVSINGKKAFFSSNNLSDDGGWDIYSFDLHNSVRPKNVLLAKGKIELIGKEDVKEVQIEVKSNITQKVTKGIVDENTGEYAIAFAVEKDEEFLLTVKKKDFAFTSKYIQPKQITLKNTVKIDMEMKPIEIGKKIEIKDIHFETAKAVFDKASMFILDNFIEFLNDNPNVIIEIHGHTDNEGDRELNLKLSLKRAKAVHDYLVIMGVSSNQIIDYKGFGENKPKTTNKTIEGRAINRRTEFVIISN